MFISPVPMKKPGRLACVWNPSARETEDRSIHRAPQPDRLAELIRSDFSEKLDFKKCNKQSKKTYLI